MSCSIYKSFFAPFLFRLDPEKAHHLSLLAAGVTNLELPNYLLRRFVFTQPKPGLSTTMMGLRLKSPLCIAAGLDKNCDAFETLGATGVGAIELGTVTPEPQVGNPKPRIFRFPKDRSLINRLGFPSCGIVEFRKRLERVRRRDVIVGVNIGKNKDTALETCELDYERCTKGIGDLADYLVINVSSPNTPGLRALQSPEMLSRVVRAVQNANTSSRPIAVKISPDCSAEQIGELVDCCRSERIQGIIASNTTLWRPEGFASTEAGGLSGALLRGRASETIRLVCERVGDAPITVIGAGGVSTASQVQDLIKLGCSAVQLYSALVFEGPGLISVMNNELSL